jgi:protein-disulfide isomerase
VSPQLTVPVGDDDHCAGPVDAPITLVEYGDFECPHCGRAYPKIKRIQKALGDKLCLVFRNFPLSESHPHAVHAAEAAEAAGAEDKFWEMHDLLFENQDALEDEDLVSYAEQIGLDAEKFTGDLRNEVYADEVRNDFRNGIRSGVNGTPTFFVNGERYDGDWSDTAAFTEVLLSTMKSSSR